MPQSAATQTVFVPGCHEMPAAPTRSGQREVSGGIESSGCLQVTPPSMLLQIPPPRSSRVSNGVATRITSGLLGLNET